MLLEESRGVPVCTERHAKKLSPMIGAPPPPPRIWVEALPGYVNLTKPWAHLQLGQESFVALSLPSSSLSSLAPDLCFVH